MSTSTLKVNIGFLEGTCLKGVQAWIYDMEIVRRGDGSKYLLLHIEGPDVPKTKEVTAIITQTTKLEACE